MKSAGPQQRESNSPPTLETIRFGEFLRERQLINDEQLLEALADHWCNGGKIGSAVARQGFMSREAVEREAARYHDLDVLEV